MNAPDKCAAGSWPVRILRRNCLLALVMLCTASFAQEASNAGLRVLQVDASKVIGEIHSFQGVNGPPSPLMVGFPNLVEQYRDLRVNLVRTHDFMGPTEVDSKFEQTNPFLTWLVANSSQRAGVVQAGNADIIFPEWGADPEKPSSYNFGPTDRVLAAIHETGAAIYYRIGRSWGANADPPDDFDKFASVIKHIAMHDNQGWANGFHYDIRYWEFWNEPDILFWSGTPEQFYFLYEKAARALKSADPTLKVGGDAKAFSYDGGPFREGFIDYCAAHKLPLDFYSWHTYADRSADPYDAVRLAKQIRGVLDTHGFPKAESILSEWNLTPGFTDAEKARLQGVENAAFIGAALSYFQDATIDRAMFYRGDAGWMGLFGLDGQYFKTAYAFKAMGKILDTPQRLAASGTDTFGFATVAGRSVDGKTVQVLISNYAIPAGFKPNVMQMPPELLKAASPLPDFSGFKLLPPRTDIVYRDNAGYNLTISNLPWGKSSFSVERYRISKTQNLDLVDKRSSEGPSFNLSNALALEAIELIVLERR